MLSALVALVLLQAPNTLTADEAKQGWRLLFDGRTTQGWRNFKSKTISDGWQVKDGTLAIVNPDKAGDIVSVNQFDWFELVLDFKVGKGQNSGIMYHVNEKGETTWQSGPEVQIYDHPFQPGVQTTGFLYELYGAPRDASKPAGEWNTMRLLISPAKCETWINGVKYHEYVLGSPEFNEKVAKSKFSEYPYFAKERKGHIGIQGDHGTVAFRNMKIRPIK